MRKLQGHRKTFLLSAAYPPYTLPLGADKRSPQFRGLNWLIKYGSCFASQRRGLSVCNKTERGVASVPVIKNKAKQRHGR